MSGRRLRVHLSTLAILGPLLSVMIYFAVFRGRAEEYEIRESQNFVETIYINHETSYGFPVHVSSEHTGVRKGQTYRELTYRNRHARFSNWRDWAYYAGLGVNVMLCAALTIASGVGMEWYIRRREAKAT